MLLLSNSMAALKIRGDAPDFVEVGEAGIAAPWIMLCGISVEFNLLSDVFRLMSCKKQKVFSNPRRSELNKRRLAI